MKTTTTRFHSITRAIPCVMWYQPTGEQGIRKRTGNEWNAGIYYYSIQLYANTHTQTISKKQPKCCCFSSYSWRKRVTLLPKRKLLNSIFERERARNLSGRTAGAFRTGSLSGLIAATRPPPSLSHSSLFRPSVRPSSCSTSRIP